jgi:hypothetical protein
MCVDDSVHVHACRLTDVVVSGGRCNVVAHAELAKETQETASLSKHIKEMELELARLRAVYPVEDVSVCFSAS